MRQSFMSKAATLAAGIAVSTAVSVALGSEAQAATITRTVNGVSYDISTVEGTFEDLRSTLESQVWWGSLDAAAPFATAVSDAFGGTNLSIPFGPFYAVGFQANLRTVEYGTLFLPTLNAPISSAFFGGGLAFSGDRWTFATAVRTPTTGTAIPTPALLPALMGFGVSIWRKRKDERRPVEA
jgi:hypothetical protein